MDSAICSSPVAVSSSVAYVSALRLDAEPGVMAAAEEPSAYARGQEGHTSAAAATVAADDRWHQQPEEQKEQKKEDEYEWPAVSFARMRAGLRSALKTECSGFNFQNGGRSVRWFREHPTNHEERARLLWQGHVSLFELCWEAVSARPIFPDRSIKMEWVAFNDLCAAYRRYCVVPDDVDEGDDAARQRCAYARQVMLTDGTAARSVRWALDPRSGLERIFLPIATPTLVRDGQGELLALALLGEWQWLLERWRSIVVRAHNTSLWQVLLVQGASTSGSLPLVKRHWPGQVVGFSVLDRLPPAIGQSGSVEVYEWVRKQWSAPCFARRTPRSPLHILAQHALAGAGRSGHLELVKHAMRDKELGVVPLRAAADMFAKSGQLQVLEWIAATQNAAPADTSLQFAVSYGKASVMRYLHQDLGITCVMHSLLPVLRASPPECFAVVEAAVQHFQYVPCSDDIVEAATSRNVRPGVLRFLAMHAPKKTWDDAYALVLADDPDAQDLMRAAASNRSPGDGDDV